VTILSAFVFTLTIIVALLYHMVTIFRNFVPAYDHIVTLLSAFVFTLIITS